MNGSRFPFPSFPTGWYNIGASAQVRPGGVVALDLLGRELVCYRGASGRVAVIDAFCPHLGAHIGVGGHVEEDDIVCPFHGWRFDTSGRNVDIPYRDQANKRAALFVYPVRELAGMIFIWFILAGHPPRWDLPVLPELEYPDYALSLNRRMLALRVTSARGTGERCRPSPLQVCPRSNGVRRPVVRNERPDVPCRGRGQLCYVQRKHFGGGVFGALGSRDRRRSSPGTRSSVRCDDCHTDRRCSDRSSIHVRPPDRPQDRSG